MLYISDLDGTLLQSNAELSPFSTHMLNQLIGQGVDFSIATARSIVSVQPIMDAVSVSLPIICANGAYLADITTGQRSDLQLLRNDLSQALLSLVRKHSMDVFAVCYEEGSNQEKVYVEQGRDNPLLRRHFTPDRWANDERLQKIGQVESVISTPLLNINVMSPLDQMLEFRKHMEQSLGEWVTGYLYEAEGEEGWFWMSVFHKGATKGKAIQRLANKLNISSSDIVVFGDQINDFSMFETAEKAIAMGNAHPKLKQLATEVIGTNEEDSVVKYIASHEAMS
ncbi:MAG: HAD family hydrolase [Bacteroidota bacterium]